MKTLKRIFAMLTLLSMLTAVFTAFCFDGDSISLDNTLTICAVCVTLAIIGFAGYLKIEKIEKENDWIELLKKPQSGSNHYKGHR